jgi:hypothetical protein
LLEFGEFGDLLVACLDAISERGVLGFQSGDLEFAWIRDGARFAERGEAALELLGQVLVRPWALV